MGKKKIMILSGIVIAVVVIVVGCLIRNYRISKINEVEKITEFKYFTLVKEDKTGIIDNQGNVLIEPEYYAIRIPNPSKPVFICIYNYDSEKAEYETKVLNDKNEEIFTQYEDVSAIMIKEIVSETPYEKRVLKFKEDKKYGLIDFKGNVVVKAIYDELDSISYKEGAFLVKKDDKYGVINDKGKVVLDLKYDSISGDNYYSREKGYQIGGYIVGNKTDEGYRYGYYDYKGKNLLKIQYNKVYRMTEMKEDKVTYLVAEKDGQAGVLKNEKVIIPHEYDNIEYDDLNQVFIVERAKKYGMFNKEGKQILQNEYQGIILEGIYAYAEKDEETIVFDMNGNKQEALKYKSIVPTENENYYITVDKDDKYGVESKDGRTIIPNKYSYMEYVYQDYFIVGNEEGKAGLVNSKNEAVLNVDYEVVQKLEDCNLVQTIRGAETQLFDGNMNKLISIQEGRVYQRDDYVEVYSSEVTKYFSFNGRELKNTQIFTNNQLFATKKDNKWGFIDKEGNQKVDYQYEKVTEFNSYGFAGIKKDGKWGVIKQDGTVILEPVYVFEKHMGEPEFIGKYYKALAGYGETYYTDEILVKE